MNKRWRFPILFLSLVLAGSMAAADVKQVLESTAVVIEEAFVDAERAKVIARELRAKTIDPKLEGKALADALTKAVQSIENDGHMNVRFDAARAGTPFASKDEIQERVKPPQQMRRVAGGGGAEPKRPEELHLSSRMLGDGIGYIEITEFTDGPEALDDAMTAIQDARAVIVDLRQNRGGMQGMVNHLASFFFPADDRVLLTSRFRARPEPIVNRVIDVPTRKLENVPLYILISDRTFSAGEAAAYILQQFGRAQIIGEKTRGGGRHNRIVDIGGGFDVSVSIGTVEHPKTGKGWQETGVVPDVATSAEAAFETAKKLARAALETQRV